MPAAVEDEARLSGFSHLVDDTQRIFCEEESRNELLAIVSVEVRGAYPIAGRKAGSIQSLVTISKGLRALMRGQWRRCDCARFLGRLGGQ